MATQYGRSKVGFPIRRSLDQSSFAAPQGLSQRTTSFIASQRQGIHQMLLRHLIALMIDVRARSASRTAAGDHAPFTVTIKTGRPDPFGPRLPMLAEHDRPKTSSRCPNGHIPSSRFNFALSGPWPQLTANACLSGRTTSVRLSSSRRKARLTIPQDHGGDRRDRTDDLMLAKQPLSQLSYVPCDNGGPGTTRTSDLTLIRGAL